MTHQQVKIPEFITHYHLPDKQPFLNLSDLSDEEKRPVLEDLEKRRLEGKMKRYFPDWYFPQRKEAESNLFQACLAKGIEPTRKAPHYFTLGRSQGIEMGYNNDFKTVQLSIKSLRQEVLFSIGDTLWTFSKSYTDQVKWKNEWYHGQLYTYDETKDILSQIGLDVEDAESLKKYKVPCVEALVWSDVVLNDALQMTGLPAI
ncbi:hypothetical protein BKI52_36930 [marine bacterium AO1-C]|nr:hypothetical protein BKI52_36930 [marine bacterium AO1-C]